MQTPIAALLHGDPPVPVAPDATVADAVALMRENNWSTIVVADRHEVVGVFTERDYLMRACAPDIDAASTPIADMMTRSPEVLSPEHDVAYAINLMATQSLRSVPIVDQAGRLAAVFSAADLMAHLGEVFTDEDAPVVEVAAPEEWVDIGGDG